MFFYIHIPFCRQKCQYCHFALTPVFDEQKIRTYIDFLKNEVVSFFGQNPETPIETIYFGGGTPSILTGEQISEILNIFHGQKGFASISEITLESNPEDITGEYISHLSELGINRLSLGIQTFNSTSLQIIGRAKSNDAIFQALNILNNNQIGNISIDLIAGLPGTSKGQVTSDLENIFAHISPKHVSIYMLEDEVYPAHWTPYLPNEEDIRDEYLAGMEWLTKKGFSKYELSNFALPGFESKHNQSYWNHSNYKGFGLSAASYIDGIRSTNSPSFFGYYTGKQQGKEVLSTESFRIEKIMFGFRTSGVDIDNLGSLNRVKKLKKEGLVEIQGGKVFPTSTGIFLIDYIIGELI